jgi:hypothetical protein
VIGKREPLGNNGISGIGNETVALVWVKVRVVVGIFKEEDRD